MNILVTGGAGYIGSHILVELISSGHNPIVLDNFSNSNPDVFTRLEKITGVSVPFISGDIRDQSVLDSLFEEHNIDAVIHCAGLKAVAESIEKPLEYYDVNGSGTVRLLGAMKRANVRLIIFSSSATVYGTPTSLPIAETSVAGIDLTNPYGRTKYIAEQILHDVAQSDPALQVTVLRYFNPIGAHESGLIGENPLGIPGNLLPYVAQVAVGKREYVGVFGDDYDTPDGTGVRDYIHVTDLAKGHVAALEHATAGTAIYNLGTGEGTSVLELIALFSTAAGKEIPYKVLPRRPGDIATTYCDPSKAHEKLGWHAEKSVLEACKDAWRWQSNNQR